MKLLEILVRELPKRGGWPASLYNYSLLQVSGGGIYQSGGGVELFVAELADDWNQTEITREQYEAALAASKAEWNGEGEPPVGTECEFRVKGDSGWEKGIVGVVNYKSPFTVVISGDECEHVHHPINLEFRPIQTEVDKKREEAVKAMATLPPDESHYHAIYDAIAAGKIPHIRID